jgi:superfamily I DNA and/or RNA helicase
VDVVVACYGFFDTDRITQEMDFLYNRNRLNVSITRARKACILLYTDAMVRPSLAVMDSEERRAAFEHLLLFAKVAEKLTYQTEFAPLRPE